MTASLDLPALEARLARATPEERLAFAVETWGDRLLFTSSFGADSGVLLHMWSRVAAHLPVVVVDTGFLFDETHAYIEQMTRELGLRVEFARPAVARDDFLWEHGADVMARDPDFCCAQNKIAPLRPWLEKSDAWVSGLRRDQSPTRAAVPIVEQIDGEPLRCHPLATMTAAEARAYVAEHRVPEHPLRARRYLSIGCWPCTREVADGEDARAGRWSGQAKTECGLHPPHADDVVPAPVGEP